ncbi:hypothetical protein ABU614_00880 [Lysobacter firmicutimachus]|uniref:Uncharacterized protein n=1 Tax=Lysobacter firmicutimachus TaxID=1792846 RepID=A0AAU8MSV4_9GAMM
MKALSQVTLVGLARAGAVLGYTLHGRADGYACRCSTACMRPC